MMTTSRIQAWVISIGFPVVLITLLFLPASYFNDGNTYCLYTLATGENCFACGTTRSVMNLIHFKFQEAYQFNPLGYLTTALLGGIWISQVTFLVKQSRKVSDA